MSSTHSSGEVQPQVVLATADDGNTAVASAVEAQKEWAAWNPQRRARVLMKFIELVNANTDELAEPLSIEHGKTIADSRDDIQRGIEVIEFAIGIPHLLRGEDMPAETSTAQRLLAGPAAVIVQNKQLRQLNAREYCPSRPTDVAVNCQLEGVRS